MGCALGKYIDIAKKHELKKEEFSALLSGVVSCSYHNGMHFADGTFKSFQNKRGEYFNEELPQQT